MVIDTGSVNNHRFYW